MGANFKNEDYPVHPAGPGPREGREGREGKEAGMALILVLFALALISSLGLIMTMNAIMGLRISDNHESHVHATLAAISGLNHARAVVRGLDFDSLLKGPDGVYGIGAADMEAARSFEFRMPFAVLTAQMLNIESPLDDIGHVSNIGIISTGALGGSPGTALIPLEGIAQWADNPSGAGQALLSRYFVKVTNNNGEASELAADASDNPFIDGDGTIIVRSIGIARTFSETTGTGERVRRNSVVVFESRLRRAATWDLGPALNILGPSANAVFTGSPEISGGVDAGIGILNASAGTGLPERLLLEVSGGNVTGGALPSPSIQNISAKARNDRDKAMLFDAGALNDFIERRAPRMADAVYEGDRFWTWYSLPFLGYYDKTRPWNDPVQRPSIVLVKGNLTAPDGLRGAGVLIVTGRLECSGMLDYRGLVLVLGAGDLSLAADGPGIAGGVVMGKLVNSDEGIAFGDSEIDIGGTTRITADKDFVRMAHRLFPVEQISFREIAGSDP